MALQTSICHRGLDAGTIAAWNAMQSLRETNCALHICGLPQWASRATRIASGFDACVPSPNALPPAPRFQPFELFDTLAERTAPLFHRASRFACGELRRLLRHGPRTHRHVA